MSLKELLIEDEFEGYVELEDDDSGFAESCLLASESGYCEACLGSGEGSFDGSICTQCKGTGEVSGRNDPDDFEFDFEPDTDVGYWE